MVELGALPLEDAAQIRHLLAHYAHVHDQLDLERVLALFTANGRYVSRGNEHVGQAALRALLGGVYARRPPRHRMKHVYTNSTIRLDSVSADVTSDFVAYECTADGPWTINSVGQCIDRLVRQEGRWLIAERRIQPA